MWAHSTAKAGRDAAVRQARTEAGVAVLEALDAKLAGPRSRFKTRVAVEQAATDALTDAHAERWVTFTVTETITKGYKQERRGRPGPATRYREITTSRFSVQADVALDRIAYDAASDGCFPLHAARRVMPHPRRTPRPPGGDRHVEFGIILLA